MSEPTPAIQTPQHVEGAEDPAPSPEERAENARIAARKAGVDYANWIVSRPDLWHLIQ